MLFSEKILFNVMNDPPTRLQFGTLIDHAVYLPSLPGDMVFVNHEAVAWPARIEDPSCVQEMVTRHQYAVFLYGIHER